MAYSGSQDQAQQKQRMHDVLRQYWGYSSFREPQEQVILNALAGGDSMVVMATGGGKSICYQVPPLITGLPCVVVSPLIALMEDQVAALTARGIKAAFLGSAQMSAEVKRKAWAGEYQLIYITPELATNNTSSLQQLHTTHCIGLIAIDEAHCVSEWGHDFRPSYRQLGLLREALPGVPLMAVTATATQQVRKDITNQLHMGKPGQPRLQQWVMSFQRTNLHLSVAMKAGTAAAANLAALVKEAHDAEAKGLKLDSILIYAQTTKEVDELAAYLQSKGVSAVKYHAKLSVRERNQAHRDFQHDDASVMVASLAFGMGIDKPNIRRIVHYGIPSSLESYYQQAGRAGRDGMPAQCSLLWAPQDFMVQDLIKGASNLTGWNLDSHQRGMASLRAYTSSGDCRHAALVNFFQPGTLPPEGPCAGGCDNCNRRSAAAAAAAASGTQVAPGMSAGETDVTEPARLLVATVKALRHYGMNKAIAVLRGSKAKSLEAWMIEAKAADGTALHGAGNSRSEDWWKGFANVLLGQGLLASQSKTNQLSGASFSIVQVTPKGTQLLADRSQRLRLMLPAHLEAEEAKRQQKEAVERQRAAAREAAQQVRDEEVMEKQQLLEVLKRSRKATADNLGQAPDWLVSDFTLNQLAELRPGSQEDLQLVSGFGQAALQHFAEPLLAVLTEFCSTSKHLKQSAVGQWRSVRGNRPATQHMQQTQGFTQRGSFGAAGLSGFACSTPAVGSGTGQTLGGTFEGFAYVEPTQLPAEVAAAGGAAAGAAAGGLYMDQAMYQSMLESKILNEPKGAATAAWERWAAGETAEQVASLRDKPIQVSTVLGYLAESAAAAGASATGCPLQQLQRLQQEACLAGAAADMQLWRIAAVLHSKHSAGLSAVKSALPADVSYGEIKVVAAMVSLQVLPGPSQFAEQELHQVPARQVQRTVAVDKLLPFPSSSAQKLYAMWSVGVPLAAVGNMDGMNMQLSAVLGALADMAAAGYPTDMQQLAAAAQLQESSARAIAAAIHSQGHVGIHAVKQLLDAHVEYGQIKVVAALIALQEMWFAECQAPAAAAADEDAAAKVTRQEPEHFQAAACADQAGQQEQKQSGGKDLTGAAAPVAAKQQQQQQLQPCSSSVAPALTNASNLPLPTPAATAPSSTLDAALVDDGRQHPVGDGASAAAGSGEAAAPAPATGAAVKRARQAFCLSNKTGKRRKPTSIAPPKQAAAAAPLPQAAAAVVKAAGDTGIGEQQQQQQQQLAPANGMESPAPVAATGVTPGSCLQQTPAGAAVITQRAVLQVLWNGAATAPQLLKQLGVTGLEQERQLQRVLQALVESGEQVCTTPEGKEVNLHDPCVRYIAF